MQIHTIVHINAITQSPDVNEAPIQKKLQCHTHTSLLELVG